MADVEKELWRLPGPSPGAEEKSATKPFFHSDYYEREMGKNLSRYFLLFERLASPASSFLIKLRTDEIRRVTSAGAIERSILIRDIALEQVVLATTGYRTQTISGNGILET